MADMGLSPFSGTSTGLTGTPINWDVDNDGSTDFQFIGSGFGGSISVNSNGLNGSGWVRGTADAPFDIRNLASSQNIGATLAGGYAWGSSGNHVVQATGIFIHAKGFSDGVVGYSGFRFDHAGSTHYGWVEWTHDLAGVGQVSVSNWAWEDVAGQAIHLADTGSGTAVPTPGSLALLAAGAGGLLAWRRRKTRLCVEQARA